MILTLAALLSFSGCSKEIRYVHGQCPALETFGEMNGTVTGAELDVEEVNETILSIEDVRAGKFNDMWLTNKKQIRNLYFYVEEITNRLIDSVFINHLYDEQISEYNANNSKKVNRWQTQKE